MHHSSAKSIVITSTVTDRLNSNAGLRDSMSDGFSAAFPNAEILAVPLSLAPSYIAENSPDLVIAVGGLAIDSSNLWDLKKACLNQESRFALWLHDDPYEFDYAFKVEKLADIIFTNDAWAKEHYNHPEVYHIPLGGCKKRHFREITPAKAIDAFFCGVAYPNRVWIFRELTPILSRYKTKILGDAWPVDMTIASNRRISSEKFCDMASTSRFVFNIGRDFNLANKRFELVPSTPGPRTFEVALAGAAQMFFVDSLEILDYFDAGSEILLFDSISDVRFAMERAIEEPQWILDIAIAAQKKALAEHTYESRAKSIVKICEDRLF